MIAALVLGILSVVFSLITFFVFWWLAIVALILGILAIVFAVRAKKKEGTWKGAGVAGLVTGIIGLVLSSISLLLFIILLALAAAA